MCKVVRYPCEEMRQGHFLTPGYIELKVTQVLVGTEAETDLLVEWVDYTRNDAIKEGGEYVVFLRRGEAARVDYWGVSANASYGRFNCELWTREIQGGKAKWLKNRPLTVAQLLKLALAKSKVAAVAPRRATR